MSPLTRGAAGSKTTLMHRPTGNEKSAFQLGRAVRRPQCPILVNTLLQGDEVVFIGHFGKPHSPV